MSRKVRWESSIRVSLHPAKPNAGEMQDVVSGIVAGKYSLEESKGVQNLRNEKCSVESCFSVL